MANQRAGELIQAQLQFGGGYNRNAVRLIPAEVRREHGHSATDALIGELVLEQAFGLKPDTDFAGAGR
jgi:hypothetical protein